MDLTAGTSTLRSRTFDMDGMTMVFRIADPEMLDKAKAGD